MAPPPQPIHKQEHHGLLHQHHGEAEPLEETPPEKCPNNKTCNGMFPSAAKFCSMCGEPRPKPKSPRPKKPSALEADCVNKSGFRHTVWLFVHTEVRETPCVLRYAERYELITILFVLYLVLSDIIVSIPEIGAVSKTSAWYLGFESFIYGVFTVEYLLRIWSSMESKELSALGSIKGRLKLMRGVIEMVDLIVLIAYYINFIPGMEKLKGLQALRMIRLLRVAALLKVERKTSSFSKIMNVLKTKKSELMATLFTALVLMLMSATTMYYIENEDQPDAFGSVPASMWWSVASLTTVGYGDVVPITSAGKVLGTVVAFFGVGLFALPAGILGSGFVEEVDKAKRLAAKENEEEDVADEVLGEQEIEANKIDQLTTDVKALQVTVEGMKSGQSDIAKFLNTICPALEVPIPSERSTYGPQVTDTELAALQESVIIKLDSLKRVRIDK